MPDIILAEEGMEQDVSSDSTITVDADKGKLEVESKKKKSMPDTVDLEIEEPEEDTTITDEETKPTDSKEETEEPDEEPISSDLIEQARKAGISSKIAKKFDDPDELRDFIHSIESRTANADAKPADENPSNSQELFKPFDGTLPDDIDEEVASYFKSMNEYYGSVIKNLSDQFNSINSTIKSNEAESFYIWVDRQFDELGDDYQEVFGKGNFDSVSKEFQDRRNEVENVFFDLAAGRKANGKKIDRKELFHLAVNTMANSDAIKSKKIEKQLKRQSARIGTRPSKHQGSNTIPHGEERAKKALEKQFMKD